LVQPGPVPSFVGTAPQATGPTYDDQDYAVELVVPTGELSCGDTIIGGEPIWLRSPEWPEGDWRFVGQLGELPFKQEPNFGDAGTAYAFVDESSWERRVLWQCPPTYLPSQLPSLRRPSSMSAVAPAKEKRTNSWPCTGSKSMPGTIATPVSSRSLRQKAIESSVRCLMSA
jgi:hypothetical protein